MNMNTINLSNYNRYQLECFPKSGLLVIFPSWMKHSVPNNPTKKRSQSFSILLDTQIENIILRCVTIYAKTRK